jgi:hypothetical protein
MTVPFNVHPHTPGAQVLRFQNGRSNLRATLKNLPPGHAITIRHPHLTLDSLAAQLDKIKYAARNARTRIEIRQHPALNTVVIISRGRSRKRIIRATQISSVDPKLQASRGPRFQGWRNPAVQPDIFS